MLYHQLVMPRESAWDILNGLGELGAVQLIDQDPSVPMIHRPFANYIKRYLTCLA
jgi:V-type H+-transporting ATPase subunit a